MEFSLSREQDDLRTTLRDFLSRRSGDEARRTLLTSGRECDRDLWRDMAEQLGLQGLSLAEEVGGSGAGFVETSIVFEELGRDLCAVPYFSTVAASWVLAEANDAEDALAPLLDGSRIATLAITDTGSRWPTPSVQAKAIATSDSYRIFGSKAWVTDLDTADDFVVYAQLPTGAAWFLVAADSPGVTVETGDSLDLTRPVGQVTFHDAPATLLIDPATAAAVFATVNNKAAVALAAEMVGGASAALEQSVAWSLDRTQFGRPIGSFQAIKHMCADTLMDIEAARVLTTYAAHAIDENRHDTAVVASMAKQAAADAFIQAAGNNIQIHGGIGFTWEHDAHLYFRRARASAALFGTPDQHRDRISELLTA